MRIDRRFVFVSNFLSLILWTNQVYGIEPTENAIINGGQLGQSN